MELKITIASIDEARKILNEESEKYNAFISITNPNLGSMIQEPGHFGKFYLKQEYHDVNLYFEEYFGIDLEKDLPGKVFPKKENVEELINFFRNAFHSLKNPSILIHCHQGKSRSVGAALIGFFLFYRNESIAIERLKSTRSGAMPNGLLVQYADEILGSNLDPYARELSLKEIVSIADELRSVAREIRESRQKNKPAPGSS